MGFCYRKYPYDANEIQSRDKIKGWEQLQIKIDEEVPSYYKYPDGANALNLDQGKKRAYRVPKKKSLKGQQIIHAFTWPKGKSAASEDSYHFWNLQDFSHERRRFMPFAVYGSQLLNQKYKRRHMNPIILPFVLFC